MSKKCNAANDPSITAVWIEMLKRDKCKCTKWENTKMIKETYKYNIKCHDVKTQKIHSTRNVKRLSGTNHFRVFLTKCSFHLNNKSSFSIHSKQWTVLLSVCNDWNDDNKWFSKWLDFFIMLGFLPCFCIRFPFDDSFEWLSFDVCIKLEVNKSFGELIGNGTIRTNRSRIFRTEWVQNTPHWKINEYENWKHLFMSNCDKIVSVYNEQWVFNCLSLKANMTCNINWVHTCSHHLKGALFYLLQMHNFLKWILNIEHWHTTYWKYYYFIFIIRLMNGYWISWIPIFYKLTMMKLLDS